MAISPRTYRRAQLWAVRASDPVKFCSLYRDSLAIRDDDSLPAGVTYSEMIDTILDREEIDQLSAKVMQAIAS